MTQFKTLLKHCAAAFLAASTFSSNAQTWQRVVNLNDDAGSAIGAGSGNTIYAGLAKGSVYRSDDNGLTWTQINSGLVDSSSRLMVPKAFVNAPGGRVLRGGDNASWENRIGSPVFYTDNQGAKWNEVPLPFASPTPNPGGIGISDMVAHQGALYFSDLLSGGVWRSADAGLTWTSVGGQLPTVPFVGNTKVYYAVASAGNALLTVEGLRGVFRSIDGGTNWTQSVSGMPGVPNSPLVGGTSWTAWDVAGAADGTVFAAVDQAVYRSRDGGASWEQVGGGLFSVRKVELLGDRVYVTSNDGNPRFFEGTSLGESWTELPQIPGGAANASILSQSFTAHNGAVYFAGTNGVYRLDLATASRTNLLPLVSVNPSGPLYANVGGTVKVRSTVRGTAPFSYEWRLNNLPIDGQTAASFNLTTTSTNQTGSLTLIVSNAAGKTTNSVGQLTVATVAAGVVDYSFRPQFLSGLFPGISVNSLAVDQDGSVFYGGDNVFSYGGVNYRGLRHAFADGLIDSGFITGDFTGFGSGPGIGIAVRTLLPMGDGSVLVGAAGSGNEDRYWRRLLSNGSIDAAWPWPAEVAGGPRKVTRLADGKMLLAGGSVGGLHRLNADGTLDASFNPLPSIGRFQGDFIRDFVVLPDGKIVVVGKFTVTDAGTFASIVRLFPNGGLDRSFLAAQPFQNNEISAIIRLSDGKFLLGGTFNSIGGQAYNNLARLNADGSLDTGFPKLNPNSSVYTFALQPDGMVWVGGAFTGFSGRNYLVRLNVDGSADSAFPDVGVNGIVQVLQVSPAGRLWIGSSATTVGGLPGGQLVRVFLDTPDITLAYAGLNQTADLGASITLKGSVTGPYTALQWRFNGNPISGANSLDLPLNNLTLDDSGRYELAVTSTVGNYTSQTASLRVRGAVVIDRQPDPLVGMISNSVTFAVAAFGKLPLTYQWFKGDATIANATNRSLILTNLQLAAAADYKVKVQGGDGSTATSDAAPLIVIPQPGLASAGFKAAALSGTVFDLEPLEDGKLLVAAGAGVTRLKADGSVDSGFNFSSAGYLEVNNLEVQPDGRIVIIARSSAGGAPYVLRRLNADGTADASFTDPTVNPSYGLKLSPDGGILLANDRGIIRYSAEGVEDTVFGARSKLDSSAISVSVDPTGRIYVAGNFTTVAGKPRPQIARLLPDGSLDATFAPTNKFVSFWTVTALSDGVIVKDFYGLYRFNDLGVRDDGFEWGSPLEAFDLTLTGGIAGSIDGRNGLGAILTAEGSLARPVGRMNIPSAGGAYLIFRVGRDGAFYAAPTSGGVLKLNGTINQLAFLTHPASQTVDQGASVTLSVTTIGTTPVSYQWRHYGTNLAGQTSATLVLNNLKTTDSGTYSVVIANRSGSMTSHSANLIVLGAPEIISQTTDLETGFGETFVLKVLARGLGLLGYQWMRNDVAIPGAIFASYTNLSAKIADSGDYKVVVTSSLGSAASTPIHVKIISKPGSLISSFPDLGYTQGVKELNVLPNGNFIADHVALNLAGQTLFTLGGSSTDLRGLVAVDAARQRIFIGDGNYFAYDLNGAVVPGIVQPGVFKRTIKVETAGTVLVTDASLQKLQRIGTNGNLQAGFTSAVSAVTDFLPQSNGKIITLSEDFAIGGGKIYYNAVVKRLLVDGTIDGTFNSTTNPLGPLVRASRLRQDSADRVLVFGQLDAFLDQPRSHIYRLQPDGTFDSSFVPALIDGEVTEIAEQSNGKLIIVGAFTKVGGISRNLISRLNADGSHDTSFDPGTGFTKQFNQAATVYDVKILPEGQIVVAGNFDFANGQSRKGLALLAGDPPDVVTPDPFAAWAAEAGLSGADAAPDANPDHDRYNNLAEFFYGTSPKDANQSPSFEVSRETVDGKVYPSVIIVRRHDTGAIKLETRVARSVAFTDDLGATLVSTTAIGNGLDRVVIRSNTAADSASSQYFRLTVR